MEWDLQHELRVDLLDFFRHERPWAQLYRFIDKLPSWGYYKTELAMDPEFAKHLVDEEEKAEEKRLEEFKAAVARGEYPPAVDDDEGITPLGYDPVIARLDMIADREMMIWAAVVAQYTQDHKPPNWQEMPTPTTAVDKERENRVKNELNALHRLLMGEGLDIQLE